MKEISIDQLINEDQFFILKKEFLMRDESHVIYLKYINKGDPPPEVDFTLNDISYQREGFTDLSDELGISYYENNGVFVEVKENFYDDFIYPVIRNMFHSYVRQIEKRFEEKDILNPSDVKFFGNRITKILNNKLLNVNNSSHLNCPTKNLIRSVFVEIINHVYINYVKDPSADKIHFNLNKNQVVILFNILYNKKIIKAVSTFHFNEMIQKFFRYKHGTEFKDIDKAYKLYDELLGNNPSKPSDPTLNALKKIFNDPDFFNP